MPTIIQPSLSGGELAPSLHGRVDIDVYHSSVKTCLNFLPQAYGGVKNRPGTKYVGNAYSNTVQSRLVPFSFNAEQNYVLEFGGGTTVSATSIVTGGKNGTMQVWSRGKQVVYAKTELGHTKDDPVRIEIPWDANDLRALKFSQSGDVLTVTHPNYPPIEVKRLDNDRWTTNKMPFKNGPFQATNWKKGDTVAASAVKGQVTLTITGDWMTQTHVGQMFYIKQQNYGVPWEALKDVTKGTIRRSDGKYYRAVADGKTGTLRPIHDADNWSDGGVEWEFLHPGFGSGKIISVAADGKTALLQVEDGGRLPDGVCGITATGGISNITITAVAEGPMEETNTYTMLRLTAPSHQLSTSQGMISIRLILSFTTVGGSTDGRISLSNVQAIVVDGDTIDVKIPYFTLVQNEYASLNSSGSYLSVITSTSGETPQASYLWAFGAWGGDQGWPSCSAYFQQRHVFAGSFGQPQNLWASRTGDYYDFGESNPIQDDDGLSWVLASSQIDGIKSLMTLDKLVMFTLGGNWVTVGGQNEVLTPGNINTKLQNYFGSGSLAPIGIGNAGIYYGKMGTIRDLSYEFASDTYTGNDLAARANHLLANTWILEWDVQQTPFPIVWMVRDDGILVSMTYLKEERVVGWARHNLGGTVTSVAVVNECGEDHVYVLVNRTIGGSSKTYVECMYARVDDLYEARFLDSSLSYDGRELSGATMTVAGVYTAGGSVTLTAGGATPFVTGSPSADIGDQIVVQSAAGTLHRVTITSVTSTSLAGGTLDTALPADLQDIATSSWAFARDTLSGLTHLEGQTVAVYADGQTYSGTVSSGVVSLAGHPGFVVTVGLPIVADLGTLPVTVPGERGPGRELAKLITSVRVLLENSRSCYIGPDASNLVKAELRPDTDTWTPITGLGSGELECQTTAAWNKNGEILIRHTEATPLSILAILPDVYPGVS